MLEMEENVGAFDHWRALDSSKPVFEALNDEKIVNSRKKLEQVRISDTMEGLRSNKGVSIAERRAAKCGFNAESISTARFRSTSPLTSPAARSPYLTIPAGISPTALLDSPVMLHNSQALPSPTTGTFMFPPFNHESLMPNSVAPAEDGDEGSDIGSFRFKPHGSPVSLPLISSFQQPMDFEFPAEFPKEADTKNCAPESSTDVKVSKDSILNANTLALHQSHIDITPQNRDSEPTHGEDSRGQHFLEGDQKETYPPAGTIRTSEDGYNWRKYGQKQVKGSEYPRSYFKCTHQNCPVKKKVERSHDGQITEIIYKGAHNHPKPQPNRRSILGSPFSVSEMLEMGEGTGSSVKVEGGSVWRNIQLGCKDIKVGSDWRADGLERETSVVTEISDPLSTTQGKSMGVFESVGTPELSSTLGSHADYDDDGPTKGIISPGDDADDEEPELKRRKKESCLVETNMASRAVREPRVVVQIESDVDILDDGYRWRKYGQKVVKGNPNPRSYYKCTSAGCSVRKHVERASHNLKCVITTYEGKHNHEVPVARNSSHANSGSGSLPLSTSNSQLSLTLPRNANIPKPETQVQDLSLRFERKPEMGHEFMSPGLLGNFGNDMKFEPSSIYQMRFPTLQNPMPYGSNAPVLSDFPMSMPFTLPRSGNIVMGGFDFNNQVRPIGPAQSFLGGQQFRENDSTRLLKPKQEQRDETIYDTYPPNVGHTSGSSSSMYCRIMGSLPS